MKTALLTVIACALCGCAAKVVVSNPRSVVVDARNVPEAQAAADNECGKHKRIARLTKVPSRNIDEYVFDCVE